MKRLAPLVALLFVGVALAAEPDSVLLGEEDAKAAVAAQDAVVSACGLVAQTRKALDRALAEETRAKEARAKTFLALAEKLGLVPPEAAGVKRPTLSLRVAATRDGEGPEVKTVSLVATQE